jgi:flagella basal body P-ring formation protein FlgA
MGKPRILTPAEVRDLRKDGIKTPDDLWARVSENYGPQLKEVSERTGVSRTKLEDLLAAEEGRATEFKEGGLGEALRLWLKRLRRLPLGLEGSMFVLLLLVVLFLFRAIEVRESLPSPIGLQSRVLVARRDLKAGTALKPEDFDAAYLVSGEGYVPATEQLAGYFLTRDIAWGKALGFTDVKRQQLVAAKDIPAETTLGAGLVNPAWTPYQANALTELGQVEGRTSRHPIPSGSVVLFDYVK